MEPQEFEKFFLNVYPQLVRYARQGCDPSVAEDLASKTLELIWRNGEAAPADDQSFYRLRKFAFAILRRQIGHHIRDEIALRRREHRFTAQQAMRPTTTDAADEVVETEWPAWTSGLRENERQLLSLHANGYKPAEIAPILGIRASAVSARLQRVKGKARKLWRKEARGSDQE